MSNPKGGNRTLSIRIRGRHIFKYFSTSYKNQSNSQIMLPMPPQIHPKIHPGSTPSPPRIHPDPPKIHPKSIPNPQKIYRKSIENLSTQDPPQIHTGSDPPQLHPKFIPNLSKIYFTYPEIHLFSLPPLPCEAPKYYASSRHISPDLARSPHLGPVVTTLLFRTLWG